MLYIDSPINVPPSSPALPTPNDVIAGTTIWQAKAPTPPSVALIAASTIEQTAVYVRLMAKLNATGAANPPVNLPISV